MKRGTHFHFETTALELSVFLAQGTGLAEAMDEAVCTLVPLQVELGPQFGSVGA